MQNCRLEKLILCSAILTLTNSQDVALYGPVSDEQVLDNNICPEREITFTCVTTGSAIIAWVSNEYIEPGGAQLRLASFNRPGDTQNSTFNPNTFATLIRNEMDISLLESQLRIIATMDYPNPSVTCINVDHGTMNRTSFEMLDDPLMPVVEKKAVQREHVGGTCILTFCWNPPSNLNEADVMYYAIRINGTMYSRNETSTLAAFHVPNCGRHEVSISAVNRCDREGPFSDAFLLEQNIRTSVSNDSDPTQDSSSSPSSCNQNLIITCTIPLILTVTVICIPQIIISIVAVKHIHDINKPRVSPT